MRSSVPAVLAALFSTTAWSQDRPTLAVLPVAGNAMEDERELVDEVLRSTFVESGLFRVQDRAAMNEILAQQARNASEACDESCAVEQGRLLQVSRLVTASLKLSGGERWLSLRLTSVETGEVERSLLRPCQGCSVGELVELASAMARELAGVKGVAAPAPYAGPPPAYLLSPQGERPAERVVGYRRRPARVERTASNPEDWTRVSVGLGLPLIAYEWGGFGGGHWSFIIGYAVLATRYYQDPRGDGWMFTLGFPPGVGYQWESEGAYFRVGFASPYLFEYAW